MAEQSYAVNTGQEPVMQQPSRGRAETFRMQPATEAIGLTTLPSVDTTAQDKTNAALLKLGGEMLQPQIKAEAQRQFMVGVQKAQSGQALGEILKEQPWYSEVFGPSSAGQGARAYTAQMNIAKFGADLERQMPKLAEQGPEALTAAADASIKKMLTGDAATDSAITTAYVDQMAPLFKRHAHMNYIYTQNKAVDAQINAWESLGDAFQQRAAAAGRPDGGVSPADLAAEKARFIGALAPFGDQSDASYQKSMAAFLTNSASKGNFQVVKMFKEEGLYGKLDPEHRSQVDATLRAAGRRALDQQMPAYAVEIATLLHDTMQDPQAMIGKLDALNAKAAAQTGVTETELIPKSTYDNVVGRVVGAQMTAKAKQAEEDAKVALATALITQPGGADQGKALGLIDDKHLERATAAAWVKMNDPVQRAALLNNRPGGKADFVKQEFTTLMRGEEYTAGVGLTAATYDKLSDPVKAQYFSEGERRMMDNFNLQVRSGVKPEQAYANVKVLDPIAENMLPKDAKSEVHKLIRKEVENAHENIFGWNEVDDSSLRLYEAVAAKAIKSDRGMNTLDVSVKRAISQAKSMGVQQLGKHALLSADPAAPPLEQMLAKGEHSAGPKAVGAAFEELMTEAAKARNMDLGSYHISRPPDQGGKAYFNVEASDKDGRSYSWSISSDQVRAHIGKKPIETSSVLDSLGEAAANYRKNRPTE